MRLIKVSCAIALAFMTRHAIAQELPKAIARTFGECKGKILITPTGRSEAGDVSESTLLIYDCASKNFELLKKAPGPNQFGDLTAVKNGYYYTSTVFVDGVLYGEFRKIDATGREAESMRRRDLDLHDFILEDSTRLYMKYVPGVDSLSCLDRVPLHSELVEESSAGQVIWKWSSAARIDVSMNVSTPQTSDVDVRWFKRILRPIRHCITVALSKLTDVEVPKFTFLSEKHATFQFTYDDYVHANSIQKVANGNVLLSARHLDAVFEIDKKTGALTWTVAGPKSKMKGFQIRNDPLRGFSHQHSATLSDDYLLLFDNANLLARPSRAVIYRLNRQTKTADFVQHFLEPNGKLRPATGSAYFIGKKQVIVGWGYVLVPERASAQRGVSIFDIETGKETFGIDFAPGYDSYRAKWSPASPP